MEHGEQSEGGKSQTAVSQEETQKEKLVQFDSSAKKLVYEGQEQKKSLET